MLMETDYLLFKLVPAYYEQTNEMNIKSIQVTFILLYKTLTRQKLLKQLKLIDDYVIKKPIKQMYLYFELHFDLA